MTHLVDRPIPEAPPRDELLAVIIESLVIAEATFSSQSRKGGLCRQIRTELERSIGGGDAA